MRAIEVKIFGSLIALMAIIALLVILALTLPPYESRHDYIKLGDGATVIPVEKIDSVVMFSNKEELVKYLNTTKSVLEILEGRRFGYDNLLYLTLEVKEVTGAYQEVSALTSATNDIERYYSKTNVQVEGIDEADIVKTDGEYIYLASMEYNGSSIAAVVLIVKAYPPEEGGIVYRLSIPGEEIRGIYVYHGKLVVITSKTVYRDISYELPEREGYNITILPTCCIKVPVRTYTLVKIYDINSGEPILMYNTSVSGSLTGSRLYNGVLYVVTREDVFSNINGSIVYPLVNGRDIPASLIIAPKDSLPDTYVNIYRLDLDSYQEAISTFLLDNAAKIYMSYTAIYVYYTTWKTSDAAPQLIKMLSNKGIQINDTIRSIIRNISIPLPYRLEVISEIISNNTSRKTIDQTDAIEIPSVVIQVLPLMPKEITVIHRFTIDGLVVGYVGKAEVEGIVMDDFSYTEINDVFYIATHSWSNDTNILYAINTTGMNIISALQGIEQGMDIYAARFMGERCYLITYRRKDPLIVIDVSNPRNMAILGKLLMPGYSEYLHPLSSTILLGIGYTDDNRIKVETYNVSIPENPSIISTIIIGDKYTYGYSPIFHDYHAFTIDTLHKYFLVPIYFYKVYRAYGSNATNGLYVMTYSSNGTISLKGVIEGDEVTRGLYIENYIYAISRDKIIVANATTLEIVKIIELGGTLYK